MLLKIVIKQSFGLHYYYYSFF